MIELMPVDDELVTEGCCWMCRQDFVGDAWFSWAPRPEHDDLWATCIGCLAALSCDPGNPPPAE